MDDADTVIRVEHLAKKYYIRHQGGGAKYGTLRDTLAGAVRSASRKYIGGATEPDPTTEEFWALKGVSFEVNRGEVVGIIGRNGAGKSTLLKVLSRITEPTEGRVELAGRVASLLEVGTGFHPELTGRENIFLNGAILGMTRAEIRRKFDDIVTFAEVEQFLDTPVKRYSSGMYTRLAFAVAAHLDPEILIIDEVLAVGDAAFQKKCMGKMGEVARGGRTVLYVSHQLATVTNLCHTAITLRAGRLVDCGPPADVVRRYLSDTSVVNGTGAAISRPGWAEPLIQSVRTLGPNGSVQTDFAAGSEVTFELTARLPPGRRVTCPVMGVVVSHPMFGCVGGVNTRMTGYTPPAIEGREIQFRCRLANPALLKGLYTADVWFGDGPADLDVALGGVQFHVEAADIYGTGRVPINNMGVMFFQPVWDCDLVPRSNGEGS